MNKNPSPEVYIVEVAEFNPIYSDSYYSGWQCHKPLDYKTALRLFDRITGKLINEPEEIENGDWINSKDEFEAWEWFSKVTIPLPIRITLSFKPSKYVYSHTKPFGLIKEEIIYKRNKYALDAMR